MGVVLAGACVLLAAAIAYIWLLRRDLRAVYQALRLLGREDTNTRLTTRTYDAAITAMAAEMNAILDRQKALEREAKAANLRLRRAITNMSHDLRTPLTSVMGYLQLAVNEKTSTEKRREYLEIIGPRLQALSALIDELFTFSRVVEGRGELDMGRLNLPGEAAEVLSGFYGEFTGRGIEPRVSLPDAPLWILCDRAALHRILQNLIKNALVHGGGAFSLAVCGGPPRLVVANRVPEPESLDLEHIFDRFYTADAARGPGGSTGLGLAIVQELCAQMGGEVSAALEGDMLAFTVTFQGME